MVVFSCDTNPLHTQYPLRLFCSMLPPWDWEGKGNQHKPEAHSACCAVSNKERIIRSPNVTFVIDRGQCETGSLL